MAFVTVPGCRKGLFAIVTDTAGFAFEHIIHSGFADNSFVGKRFSVAIFAAVNLGMECVAESGWGYPFQVECDLFRLEPFVTAITVCCYSKSAFSVVACAAGTSFFHFRHSHRFFLAGYDFAIMTPFTGAACLGNVRRMAEYGGAKSFHSV